MKSKLYVFKAMALLIFSAETYSADSSITISGLVQDNTCSVNGDSKDFIVNFMETATKDLRSIGQKTEMIPFHITLSPCGGSSTAVKIGFNGSADRNNSKLLMVESGTSKASGIGIQILDHNKSVIPINSTSTGLSWTSLKPGKNNTLTFYTQLMVTSVPVSAGSVKASAAFTMEFQ
ncbi:fimbrial protein [Erwiniaceae bacterium CAU 1747]